MGFLLLLHWVEMTPGELNCRRMPGGCGGTMAAKQRVVAVTEPAAAGWAAVTAAKAKAAMGWATGTTTAAAKAAASTARAAAAKAMHHAGQVSGRPAGPAVHQRRHAPTCSGDCSGTASKRPTGSWNTSYGTAVCITGQLRGLPAAVANWRNGPLFRVLPSADRDLFLVTSNSSSFRMWLRFVKSELSPVGMTVVGELASFVNDHARSNAWTHRADSSGLQFNLAALPKYRDGKHATSLVQQWQLGECLRLIRRREAERGAPYALAARVRADGIFGTPSNGRPLGNRTVPSPSASKRLRRWWLPPNDGGIAHAGCNASAVWRYEECLVNQRTLTDMEREETACAERYMQPERQRLQERCELHLQKLRTAGATWANGNDWFLFGSRDAMDTFFSGLQHLIQLGPRVDLPVMIGLWHWLEAKLDKQLEALGRSKLTSSHACAIALASLTLVRAVGPPQSLYHAFADHAAINECVLRQNRTPSASGAGSITFAACATAVMVGMFQFPLASLDRDFGLAYDLPLALRGTCGQRAQVPQGGGCAIPTWSGPTMQTLALSRNRSFGGRQVGDEKQRTWERNNGVVKKDGF